MRFTTRTAIFNAILPGLLAVFGPHSVAAQVLTAPDIRHDQSFDGLRTGSGPVSESVGPSRQSLLASKELAVGLGENNGASDDTIARPTSSVDDIFDLDIDQLSQIDVVVPAFDVEVTSVTRSESTVGKSPAAIFVITPEMIRRSGVTSIPELLRMVPGIEVARIDANKWAITARGFNGRFSNKLLVMIDGRSVYTPLFSGVYWEVQDTLIEDIARIEVIRGPGSTLWGANAVNGVINIITKRAQQTQGALITSGGGTEERARNAVRYGGSVGSNFHYRFFGKHFERDHQFRDGGAHDDWRQGRLGFRADWNADGGDRDIVTLQGDYYEGTLGTLSILPAPLSNPEVVGNGRFTGGNILARWTHRLDDESDFSLQAYYDRAERYDNLLRQAINVFDVDLSHRLLLGDTHHLTWGMRYRLVSDRLQFPNPFVLTFANDTDRQVDLFSVFIQDQVPLIEDRLELTVGSKFEHNEFTGFEYQPSARLLWTLDDRHAAWAAVSRAVRTPSRSDDDVVLSAFTVVPFTTLTLVGNRAVKSGDLLAFEAGYRAQPDDTFSWDLATFVNFYDGAIGFQEQALSGALPHFFIPLVATNGIDAETYGVELAANYQVDDYWRLRGSYTFLQMQLHALPGIDESLEGSSPHNQVYLQSSWDLPHDFQFDAIGRYVDNLPAENVSSYTSLDLRLGWTVGDWELSIVGRNLLDSHRHEFTPLLFQSVGSEIERGVYAQAVWRH